MIDYQIIPAYSSYMLAGKQFVYKYKFVIVLIRAFLMRNILV